MKITKKILKTTTFLASLSSLILISGPAIGQVNNEYTNQPNLAQIKLRPSIHDGVAGGTPAVTGDGVGIAIFDGLVKSDHVDLVGKTYVPDPSMYNGTYSQADDHGTHVAGIAGASKDNNGVVGVAPGASIYSFPVFDDSGWVAYDKGAQAFNTIVSLNTSGANIRSVNMSYGPTTAGDIFLSGELNLFSNYKDDFVLVRAAGNSGANAKYEYYNGTASEDLSHLLIVGSVNGSNGISYFSNKPGEACIGASSTCAESEKFKQFWLVAPGQGILSTLPNGGWGKKSGTSMAAPQVAGAAALVWEHGYHSNVLLSPTDLASILKQSATDLGESGVDSVFGWGLLNIEAALQPVGDIGVPIGGTVDDTTPVDPPADDTTTDTTKPKKGKGGGGGSGGGNGGGKGRNKSLALLSGMIVLDEFKRPFVVEDIDASNVESKPTGGHLARLSSAVFSDEVARVETDKFTIAAWVSRNTTRAPASSFHYVSDGTDINFGVGSPSVFFSPSQMLSSEGYTQARLDGLMFNALGGLGAIFDNSMNFGLRHSLSDTWSLSSFAIQSFGRKAYLPGIPTPVPYYEGQESATFVGFSADRFVGEKSSLGLTYAALHERGSLLGQIDEGPFGFGGNGLTQTVGARFSTALLDDVSLNGFYSYAFVQNVGSSASLFESSNWRGDQFGITLYAQGAVLKEDVLHFSVIKPLDLTSGTITARVPVGREFDGTVNYEYRSTEIQRDYFPIAFQLNYAVPMGAFKAAVALDATNAYSFSADTYRVGFMTGITYAF